MEYYYADTNNEVKGPVELEGLRNLRRAGALNDSSYVAEAGAQDWKTLGDVLGAAPQLASHPAAQVFEPLAAVAPSPAVVRQPAAAAQELEALRVDVARGGSWFYWIAGLSLVNSAILIFGGDWSFFLGLGITQLIEAVAAELGVIGKVIAGMMDLMIAGTFIFFGFMACRLKSWAFLAGMILYGLDALIFLMVGEIRCVIFHIIALVFIGKGFMALLNGKKVLGI